MKITSILCTALTGASMLAGIAAHAQTQFTYKQISVPGTSFFTGALEVTDDGLVGGFITDYMNQYAFYQKTDGTYATFDSAPEVTAIDGSTVYGWTVQNSGFALDTTTGKETILQGPGYTALPNGVNKSGVLVGQTNVNLNQASQPAFTLQNGTYQTYQAPGSNSTSFNAINNQGVIVGTSHYGGGPLSSFKLSNGQQTPVAFPNAYSTIVTGINDAGQMVGYYFPFQQALTLVFYYDGTSYSTLPLPPTGSACTEAGHINNLGQFVVQCPDPQNGGSAVASFLVTPVTAASAETPAQ